MKLPSKTPILASLLATALPAMAASVIHSWDFEGDYLDNVGSAHASVTASTTVSSITGHDGGSAVFIGASASTNGNTTVNTPISPTITTPIAGFSITFWVKMADDGLTDVTGNRGFFDFSANGTDSGYQGLYQGATNKLNFRIDNGANTNNVVFLSASGVTLEDNSWHHIAMTFNPGQSSGGLLVYLDGVSVADGNAGNTTGFNSGDINALGDADGSKAYLGAFNLNGTASPKGLNGGLDDFQIWDGVLSASEVAALAIPEPSTAILGLLGALGLIRRRR